MPAPLPVGGLTVASVTLTAVVVGNAYYQKKQFYPSVVYITKSNPSMAAIYLLTFTMVILLGKILKKVFFGTLRTAEFEQLIERSFYAVTETCLAFTVFRDDFSPKFVALFTVLLFLKAFHYLTDSRVDFMERSPVITALFHARVASLLSILTLLDLALLNHSYFSTVTHGASVQLVFGFEYAILLTVGLNVAVKYMCHTIDLRSENPWENKAVYLLYTELFVGFVKVILYVVFLFIMIRVHTFPLFIIRPMYLTMRSFKNALNDVIHSRRAIHNMNTLYPDATPEELDSVVCIICREEMVSGAKKLPCGHIFHSSCLRSWFQRQQTCPTCRMNILQNSASSAATPVQERVQVNQPPPQQPAQNAAPQLPNPFAHLFPQAGVQPGQLPQPGAAPQPPFTFPMFPFNRAPVTNQQTQASTATTGTSTTTSTGTATSSSTSTMPPPPPFPGFSMPFSPPSMVPPFHPFLPFSIPPPAPPHNFSGLTLPELEQMEGRERANVEQRIRVLENIQVLLDAAVLQLSQYKSVTDRLNAQEAITKLTAEASSKKETSKESTTSTGSSKATQPSDGMNGLLENSEQTETLSETVDGSLVENIGSTKDNTFGSSDGTKDDILDPDDPQEIRRRRLEKFSGLTTSDC